MLTIFNHNPCANITAALFDLDGTLVETHIDFPLMGREVRELAARYGIASETLTARDALGMVHEVQEALPEAEGAAFRAEAFALLEEIEVRHCGNPVLIEGAEELLRTLRAAGVKVGIVTRNCRRVALELIRYAKLENDVLLTRDDVPRTKPDPAHLFAALRAMSVPDGAEAVMVGDHFMDVQAGRAAGMRTVGVLNGKEECAFEPCRPDLLVRDVNAFLPYSK
jgi:phosphoglycolate phosphatase